MLHGLVFRSFGSSKGETIRDESKILQIDIFPFDFCLLLGGSENAISLTSRRRAICERFPTLHRACVMLTWRFTFAAVCSGIIYLPGRIAEAAGDLRRWPVRSMMPVPDHV